MIRFRCQECGKKLKAEAEIIGRKVKCTRCDNVETVPESDNLAKPKQSIGSQPEKRLGANKPIAKPKFSSRGKRDLIAGAEPVELFGHSSTGVSTASDSFQPRFNVVKPRSSNLKRKIVFAAIGLVLIGVIAVAFNIGWILDASRKLSTDYENLPEVVYYRNNVRQLEKSRRVMWITGQTYIMTRSATDEEKKELYDYNASIEAQTTKSDMLERVEALFRSGEDVKAKALLVNTATELKKVRKQVDQKTREYSEKSY